MARSLDVPLEYVRLGLRFDRLESGFVDAYTGDRRVRAAVEDEPAPTPSGLRDQARALLRELDSADLPADRADHLRGQLTGLECTARKMSGEPVGFVDEVAQLRQPVRQVGVDRHARAVGALVVVEPRPRLVGDHFVADRLHLGQAVLLTRPVA